MEFVNGITQEQMIEVMKGKNQGVTDGVACVPCVYTVRRNTDHLYANKNIFQIYVEEVPVSDIVVNPKTNEWELKSALNEFSDLPVFLTMAEAVAEVKRISKFWEVDGFDSIIGWTAPEADVIEMKQNFVPVEIKRAAINKINQDVFVDAWKNFMDAVNYINEEYPDYAELIDEINRKVCAFVRDYKY